MPNLLLLVEDTQIELKIRNLFSSFVADFGKSNRFEDIVFPTLETKHLNPKSSHLRSTRARRCFLFHIGQTLLVTDCFHHRLKRELLGNIRVRNLYGLFVQTRRILSLSFLLDVLATLRGFCAFLFPSTEKWLSVKIPKNFELDHLISQQDPNLVVLFTSSYEPLLLEISALKSEYQFKLLVVLNNWDNPTSKSLLPKNIDFIAAWNEEQVEPLVKIHGYALDKLFVLGSSQSDHCTNKHGRKQSGTRKLLFVGQQNSFDERREIALISSWIDAGAIPFESLTYRPHPNSSSKWKGIEKLNSLNCVTVDTSQHPFWLEYDVVISLPTTLLLEALTFHEFVFVYLPGGGIFRTNPLDMWSKYEHFNSLREQPNLIQVKTSQQMFEILRNPRQSGVDQLQLARLFPVYKMRYTKRLASLIHSLSI